MKFLKNLTLSLLSLLLFLSLSTFGLAFMLNKTLLNPDFVTSELDRLDVSSLVKELISQPGPGGDASAQVMATLVNAAPKLEPLVKKQVNTAIYSTYDYLLGKKQSPELALTLKHTILSSDFITSLVDELDVASLAGVYLRQQLKSSIPADLGYLTGSIDAQLDDVLTEVKPWLKEQVAIAADPVVNYLLGESQSLKVVISLEPVKVILKDNLRVVFLKSPPPELAGTPPAELGRYFDEMWPSIFQQIPATFVIDESMIGTDAPAQIAQALAGAEDGLRQARQYVAYFQLAYKVLIGFMVLLILGIILLNRSVRDTTRSLGITFLTYGAFEYGGILVAKYFGGKQFSVAGLPESLQVWLPQFLDNLMSPLEIFSLVLLIGGLALIIVSFVYKPRQSST
ncbi:MAG: hypothetical protein Q7K41_06430 [Dehalococcoidales bacterium]|nr:hypothetical protein [Dehalococcoidales bacterium]